MVHVRIKGKCRRGVDIAMEASGPPELERDTLEECCCIGKKPNLAEENVLQQVSPIIWSVPSMPCLSLTVTIPSSSERPLKTSFASKRDLVKLHQNLRCLKEELHLPCSGLNTIFAGDFRQLDPIGDMKPVHEGACPEIKDWLKEG